MDGIGKVHRRGVGRNHHHLPLGREGINLVGIEVHLQAGEELVGVGHLLLPLDQLADPVEPLLVAGRHHASAGLVLPVGGDALFGDAVHLIGADLHLELMAAGAHHRGVQRPVTVGAGAGDEVLDAPRHRPPQGMNEPEDGVTGGHVLGDDADGQQVVDLVEGDLGALDLLVNGVEPLDAPLHPGLDAVFPQLLDQSVFYAAQKLLALDAAGLHGRSHLLVAHRVGVAKGQVLEFAAHLAHAQPVRQRSVDLLGLAGDGLPAVRLQVLQGAHVVQAVSQLDEHHAHVLHHGQQHLAHVFGLAVFAVGKLDFVDFGDALDDVGHLVAKLGLNFLISGGRVFNRVVQQAGGDCGRVHLHLRQHLGHLERVDDVGLAGGAHLALVVLDAKLPGLADERDVFAGTIGLDLLEQRFKARFDCALVHIAHNNRQFPRVGRGRAGNLCRNGVPDCRHALL